MDDHPEVTPELDPTAEPDATPPEPRPNAGRDARRRVGSVARHAVLAAIAFVATLALLFGIGSFVVSDPGRTGGASSSVAGSSAAGSTAAAPSPPGTSPPASAAPSNEGASTGSDPVLVGAGDIADCDLDDDRATAALIDKIPGTVFTAGDDAYEHGSPGEFRDCYDPTWGRFLSRTKPAPGNHDHETRNLAGYLGYFGTAAAPNGTSWYSYDLGTWHIIVLDSSCGDVGGCGPDSAQGRWLTADLAGSTAACTLAIWHHPRFSSGVHGNARDVAPFWRALYEAGADVVINAHDHDYERFAPQDPVGHEDRARGLREFVVGTGGAELRRFVRSAPNSEVRESESHGVFRIVLHQASYEWTFIPTKGDFRDAGSGPCH